LPEANGVKVVNGAPDAKRANKARPLSQLRLMRVSAALRSSDSLVIFGPSTLFQLAGGVTSSPRGLIA
jgi:hypothetical protein